MGKRKFRIEQFSFDGGKTWDKPFKFNDIFDEPYDLYKKGSRNSIQDKSVNFTIEDLDIEFIKENFNCFSNEHKIDMIVVMLKEKGIVEEDCTVKGSTLYNRILEEYMTLIKDLETFE